MKDISDVKCLPENEKYFNDKGAYFPQEIRERFKKMGKGEPIFIDSCFTVKFLNAKYKFIRTITPGTYKLLSLSIN